MSRRKTEGSSSTFKIGAVSLAFLILGYQISVFIHRTSVLRLESHRDSPDTVYIVKTVPSEAARGRGEGQYREAEHRGDAHPYGTEGQGSGTRWASEQKAETLRQSPERSLAARQALSRRRKVETFRFNPNTVSTEDLERLGFSPAQAASIDNYRKKGGRFRRKSDFAKSYVVADSVFERLEDFIDIPRTDINSADSALFEELPGIGPYYAAKMVSYREQLGGYSYPEQLMDLPRFDSLKFNALADLISCSPPQKPFELWSLGAEELRKHPYIRQWRTAKAIVLYRESTPRQKWSVSALSEEGILDQEAAGKLARCVIAPP